MKNTVRAAGVGIALASLILVAGCAGTGTPDAGEPSEALNAEAQAALKIVESATAADDEFVAPGPALTDVTALDGATVYYIPATLQVPIFNQIAAALTDALSKVGAKVQVCDAKGNPADAASCMAQAVDAKAAAVITNGYPYEFAPNAFDAVQAAGIPLLYGLASPAGEGDPTKVAYLTPDPIALQVWLSSWVIADSNAAANVLAIKITDTPSSTAFADLGMLATYKDKCTDCKVQVIEINVAQYDRLPSLISAALVANPDITYIHMEFDSGLPSVLQGIQSAGRDDVKVVSGDGYLSTLQDMKAGSPIVADASANYAAFAWYQADAVIRMVEGQPAPVKFAFPLRRLFTVDNVADLDVTADGEASGDWYGSVDYKAGLLDLWGVK